MSKSPHPLPEQLTQIPAERTAYAPYNFVPLPAKAVSAEIVLEEQRIVVPVKKGESPPVEAQYLVRHNEFFTGRHTGTITCTLTTETPLYVRCGLTVEEYKRSIQEVEHQAKASTAQATPTRNKPDFFAPPSHAAVIPGSSLRGLFRSMIEIVTQSKLDLVSQQKLFYRSVDKTNLGADYRSRMTNKIRAGFLSFHGDSATIEEADFYKIPLTVLERVIRNRYINHRKTKLPDPNHQYRTVWVRPHNRYKIADVQLNPQSGRDWVQGTLVITGDVPGKKHEYVIVRRDNPQFFSVASQLVQRFHDEDQLSQWQTQAFPQNNQRERAGWLQQTNQPIFFIVDPKNPQAIDFLGRAGMFRLPYLQSPFDLVPSHLRAEGDDAPLVDMTEAMFGFVRRSKRVGHLQAYAGRLRFSDAHLAPNQSDIWEPIITPPILGSPKPTTFQHYLVQDDHTRSSLHHYGDAVTETTIRGYKQYWHHGTFSANDLHQNDVEPNSTQHTRIKPVKAGVRFSFTIHFENLSDCEMGALLWVLRTADDDRYRLKLGMGKPFGMGAVKIAHDIRLSDDRTARYQTLFAGNAWTDGEKSITPDQIQEYEQTFIASMLTATNQAQLQGLSHIPRIQHFLAMLEWNPERFKQTEPRPWAEVVRYLEIERKETEEWIVGEKVKPQDATINEYKLRPVLPTPFGVLGSKLKAEPKLPPSPPKNGDHSGKITGREGQLWLVTLDSGYVVKAQAITREVKGKLQPQRRVVVLVSPNSIEIRKVQ